MRDGERERDERWRDREGFCAQASLDPRRILESDGLHVWQHDLVALKEDRPVLLRLGEGKTPHRPKLLHRAKKKRKKKEKRKKEKKKARKKRLAAAFWRERNLR